MADANDKTARIIEARLKLRERFIAKPAVQATERPLGSGAPNRHGMPKLPVGQTLTQGWPVLDLGQHPRITTDHWSLTVDGEVNKPQRLSWADFLALPQVEDVSDFHCVTGWSKMDVRWIGVPMSTLLALADPVATATHIVTHAYDTYTTNLAIAEAVKDDVLLVHTANGEPLPLEHGGPVRAITPQLYAWKGAKWINRIEVVIGDQPGFWEVRGYSNTALPWKNDRYG